MIVMFLPRPLALESLLTVHDLESSILEIARLVRPLSMLLASEPTLIATQGKNPSR
jgi:hypothetical protein